MTKAETKKAEAPAPAEENTPVTETQETQPAIQDTKVSQANITTAFTLGLCDPPDPIRLYVGESEIDGQEYLWYQYDVDAAKQIPVSQRALGGWIRNITVLVKEFKGKLNYKIDVTVQADKTYIIRSGVDTAFSRGLLLALEAVEDLKATPLTIVVSPASEEKVVFSRVHHANGERVKFDWDSDRKMSPLITELQKRLGQVPQKIEELKPHTNVK